jgi:hypothetical protein
MAFPIRSDSENRAVSFGRIGDRSPAVASLGKGPQGLCEQEIIAAQLEFYRNKKAGCAFAALAAKTPEKYGWRQRVILPTPWNIDAATNEAIASSKTTMISLIFPTVRTVETLTELSKTLQTCCASIFLEQDVVFDGFRCLGFRAQVNSFDSWISGFGPFDFFPVTRQSPFTEITFRVKPRPRYKWVMKKAPENVIHLADLDLLGLAEALFKKMWHASLERTEHLLGHKPDLKSAAKTTFSIPIAADQTQ